MFRKVLLTQNLVLASALLGTALCFCEQASSQSAILSAGSPPSQVSSVPYLGLSKAEADRLHSYRTSEPNRAQHYDLRSPQPLFHSNDPNKPAPFHPHIRYDYGATFDRLQIQAASLIVVGTITSMTEHLSANGTFVYSTLDFKPSMDIK